MCCHYMIVRILTFRMTWDRFLRESERLRCRWSCCQVDPLRGLAPSRSNCRYEEFWIWVTVNLCRYIIDTALGVWYTPMLSVVVDGILMTTCRRQSENMGGKLLWNRRGKNVRTGNIPSTLCCGSGIWDSTIHSKFARKLGLLCWW